MAGLQAVGWRRRERGLYSAPMRDLSARRQVDAPGDPVGRLRGRGRQFTTDGGGRHEGGNQKDGEQGHHGWTTLAPGSNSHGGGNDRPCAVGGHGAGAI